MEMIYHPKGETKIVIETAIKHCLKGQRAPLYTKIPIPVIRMMHETAQDAGHKGLVLINSFGVAHKLCMYFRDTTPEHEKNEQHNKRIMSFCSSSYD